MLSKNNSLKDKSANNRNKMEVDNSDKETKLESRESESYIINKISQYHSRVWVDVLLPR